MIKVEDFNVNVVQRLKKIIQAQKELTERTEKTRENSLISRGQQERRK